MKTYNPARGLQFNTTESTLTNNTPTVMSRPNQVRCTESRSSAFEEGGIYDVIRFEAGNPVCMSERGEEERFGFSKWEAVENGPKFSVGDKVRVKDKIEELKDGPGVVEVIENNQGNILTISQIENYAPDGVTWYRMEGESYSWDERWLTSVGDEAETEEPVAYISGPMTGYPDHNRDRFYEVEEIVRAMGYDVVNPARLDREGDADDTWTHQDYMRRDVKAAIDCDVFIVFDEWQNSKGATDEAYLATSCGIPLRELVDMASHDENVGGDPHRSVKYEETVYGIVGNVNLPVALEGKQLVLGGRRRDYGHPKENFERIALLWEAWMKATGKLAPGASIDIRDVGHMMIQVKQARDVNTPKRDNQVDIVGYAYALQESYEQREREGESMDDFLSTEALQLRGNAADGAFRSTKEGEN